MMTARKNAREQKTRRKKERKKMHGVEEDGEYVKVEEMRKKKE